MNWSRLEEKLFEAAQANPPSDQVPYAFDKRITALIASRKVEDKSVFWSRGLWRAAFSCLALALLLGTWMYFHATPAATETADISQDFQNTLTASADSSDSTSTP
jgi:hypothetical protein